MSDKTQFSLRLSPEFREALKAHAGGERKMADAVRNALRLDMLLRDRYGEAYPVVTSVLERADPIAVESALIAVSGRA